MVLAASVWVTKINCSFLFFGYWHWFRVIFRFSADEHTKLYKLWKMNSMTPLSNYWNISITYLIFSTWDLSLRAFEQETSTRSLWKALMTGALRWVAIMINIFSQTVVYDRPLLFISCLNHKAKQPIKLHWIFWFNTR